MDNANSVASAMSEGKLTKDPALDRLRRALDTHPHFFGVTVTYKPFAFDPKRRLYSAYYTMKNGRTEFHQLDTIYDYTLPQYDWFGPALASGPLWIALTCHGARTESRPQLRRSRRPLHPRRPRGRRRRPPSTQESYRTIDGCSDSSVAGRRAPGPADQRAFFAR